MSKSESIIFHQESYARGVEIGKRRICDLALKSISDDLKESYQHCLSIAKQYGFSGILSDSVVAYMDQAYNEYSTLKKAGLIDWDEYNFLMEMIEQNCKEIHENVRK